MEIPTARTAKTSNCVKRQNVATDITDVMVRGGYASRRPSFATVKLRIARKEMMRWGVDAGKDLVLLSRNEQGTSHKLFHGGLARNLVLVVSIILLC